MEAIDLTAEAEIRRVIDEWTEAVRKKDTDTITSAYAPDIIAFDGVGQLQFKGAKTYKEHWEACLSMCPGPMVFEVHELKIVASDDVAFAHCLIRCGSAGDDGEEKAGWMRMTVGLQRIDGAWRIAHEHSSSPFDMESGKALLDLQP